jgi:hypothetical protein
MDKMIGVGKRLAMIGSATAATAASAATAAGTGLPIDPRSLETAVELLVNECSHW